MILEKRYPLYLRLLLHTTDPENISWAAACASSRHQAGSAALACGCQLSADHIRLGRCRARAEWRLRNFRSGGKKTPPDAEVPQPAQKDCAGLSPRGEAIAALACDYSTTVWPV